jgi:hypothetical protein
MVDELNLVPFAGVRSIHSNVIPAKTDASDRGPERQVFGSKEGTCQIVFDEDVVPFKAHLYFNSRRIR